MEIFENACFSFTCEWTKTEVFKYDDIVLAFSCGRAKTIRIRYVRKKNSSFSKISGYVQKGLQLLNYTYFITTPACNKMLRPFVSQKNRNCIMSLNSPHSKKLPNILETHLESLVGILTINGFACKTCLTQVVRCVVFNSRDMSIFVVE